MRLAQVLQIDHVVLGIEVARASDLFDAIGRIVEQPRGPRQAPVARQLGRRHARRSTALGNGVALPHAAVPGLRRATAAYARLAQPLGLGAPDREPVTDVLALLVPFPGMSAEFELLQNLIHRLSHPVMAQALRQTGDAAAIHRLLTDAST